VDILPITQTRGVLTPAESLGPPWKRGANPPRGEHRGRFPKGGRKGFRPSPLSSSLSPTFSLSWGGRGRGREDRTDGEKRATRSRRRNRTKRHKEKKQRRLTSRTRTDPSHERKDTTKQEHPDGIGTGRERRHEERTRRRAHQRLA